MKNILVAYDGSETGKKALQEAKNLAQAFNANVKVVYVLDTSTFSTGLFEAPYPAEVYRPGRENPSLAIYEPFGAYLAPETAKNLSDKLRESAQKILDEGVALMEGVTEASGILAAGEPAHTIIAVAEAEKVDLIVLGHRGFSPMKQLLLGSVANKVSHNAPTSVYIVR